MGNLLSNLLRGGSGAAKAKMKALVNKAKWPQDKDILGPAFRDAPAPTAPRSSSPAIELPAPIAPKFNSPKADIPAPVKVNTPSVELPAPIAAKFNSTTAPTAPKFNSPKADIPAPGARTPGRFDAYGSQARDLGKAILRYFDPRGSNWKKALYGIAGLSFPAAAIGHVANSENEGDAMAEGIDDTFGTWFGPGTYDSARNLSGQFPADDPLLYRALGLGEVISRIPKFVDGIASIPKAVMNPGRTLRNTRGYVKGLTGMYDQGDIDKALASRQHIQGVYNRPQDVILEAAGHELRNGGTYRDAVAGMVRDQNLVSNALSKLNAGVPLNDSERQALAARGYSVPEGYDDQTRMAQTRR